MFFHVGSALLLEIINARCPRILARFGCDTSTLMIAATLRRVGVGKT